MRSIKLPKPSSSLSEFFYIVLNAGLAFSLLVLVLAIKSPVPALALVLLSKWRVLAVRPRYWFKNVRSNLVDITVGLSAVVLLYTASGSLNLQIVITGLYAIWLLLIKPRSKRRYVAIQSGVAIFVGTTALFTVGYDWPSFLVTALMWLIGFSSARHLLRHYREDQRTHFAMIWGLVMAEIGFLGYHWSFAYSLPGFGAVKLSQIALIALLLSFLAGKAYDSYYQNEGEIHSNDIMLPIIFTLAIIVVMMLFFNTLSSSLI